VPATTSPPRPATVRPHSLGALAGLLNLPLPAADPALSGISHVAQAVRPGDLYVARQGARVHGADFAAEAIAAGAAAVLTDPTGAARLDPAVPVLVLDDPAAALGEVSAWIYDRPSAGLTVIGVTGTSGKTTTCYLLEGGMRAAGHRTGLIGSVETRIAGEAMPSSRTTPEAPELQAQFAVMRERRVTAVAMEVSSHALALGRVDGTAYAAGVFTNFSQDHLDFHADMDDYFAAKSKLFDGRSAVEVLNVDDEWAARLLRPGSITVSASGGPALWRAERIRCTTDGGTTFTALGPDELRLDVALDLAGAFNADNALEAIAALYACGIDPVAAAAGMRHVAVPGRMERVDAGQEFLAFVDYAHKPGAVAAILRVLRPVTKGSLIIVLGCGGDRDRGKRPVMGAVAARSADLVIITDDNPRSEDPAAIRAEMKDGADSVPGANVLVVPGRREAIAEAVRRAGAGDTVVVAGKGHEQGQEVGGVLAPFDDRAVLRGAIGERA
jgi:UDP-N-acetylmuramoyl-L-alanyl-D-glutamate--2,6-diaminopimelate ligase